MKRSIWIITALFLASVLVICTGFTGLEKAKDAVEYNLNTIYGDANALNGVSLDAKFMCTSNLLWETSVNFENGQPVHATQFSYTPDYFNFRSDAGYDGIEVYEDLDEDSYDRIVKEYTQNLTVGEEISIDFPLNKHLQYYNLNFYLDFPGFTADSFVVRDNLDYDYAPQMRKLMDFFKIPVLENDYIHLDATCTGINKDTGEPELYYNWNPSEMGDGYSFYAEGVFAGDAYYFFISNKTFKGSTVDFSQVPGGYGIYCLPYKAGITLVGSDRPVQGEIYVDRLSNVFPLNENEEITWIGLNDDQSCILTFSNAGDVWYFRVIDRSTMTLLQQEELRGEDPQNYYPTIFCGDGYFAVIGYDKSLRAFWETTPGCYELRIDTKLYGEGPGTSLWNRALDYDGDRLIIAVHHLFENADDINHSYSDETADIELYVYNNRGVVYSGTLQSSLEKHNDHYVNYRYSNNVRPANYTRENLNVKINQKGY